MEKQIVSEEQLRAIISDEAARGFNFFGQIDYRIAREDDGVSGSNFRLEYRKGQDCGVSGIEEFESAVIAPILSRYTLVD